MPVRRSINLVPKDRFSESLAGRVLNWALTIGRYIIIMTELVVVVAFLMRFRYDMQLADLNEKIKANQEIITSYQDLETQFRFLQARAEAVGTLTDGSGLKKNIYDQISRVTPPDVFLQQVDINRQNLSLKGIALNDVGLITFINLLKNNAGFDQVLLGSLTSKGEKDPKLEFSLTAVFTGE